MYLEFRVHGEMRTHREENIIVFPFRFIDAFQSLVAKMSITATNTFHRYHFFKGSKRHFILKDYIYIYFVLLLT